jgi:hypothetical protein
MAKFMVEAAQQGYYPPKGISGNHLAAEVLGSIFGKHPVNRYWTNTTGRQSERSGNNWNKEWGQGREFMYKYTSTNTVSNPDGSPSGFEPDRDEFVIHTWK